MDSLLKRQTVRRCTIAKLSLTPRALHEEIKRRASCSIALHYPEAGYPAEVLIIATDKIFPEREKKPGAEGGGVTH